MLFLLIFIVCLILQLLLPWWIIGPAAAAMALWKGKSGKQAFFSGFLAVLLLWILMSLFKTIPNSNLLLDRVAGLFGLPATGWSRVVLVVVTGCTGGVTAGFSALAGYYWRQVVIRQQRSTVEKRG